MRRRGQSARCSDNDAPTHWVSSRTSHLRCPDFCQGQDKAEHRAAAKLVLGPDPAAVGLNDRARNRQSESGAVRLGGKKCLENTLKLVRWDTRAGVGD